ncbi:MAG: hypothetical protein JST23_08110 [Bacteroidetes bacterium]|nr:hypothetical protein [Bacteroidota bacterium]
MKKYFIVVLLLCSIISRAQFSSNQSTSVSEETNIVAAIKHDAAEPNPDKDKIKLKNEGHWKINKNRLITGGLAMLSGMAKGFNETLEFNWHGFADVFPRANAQWFWPQKSFKNKYKDGDPEKGAKFPLSTSILVFTTDQYHLNNFIHRGAMTAALVIKIGNGKKPWKQYLYDALYYTACYQAGFGGVYYFFKSRMPK